MSDEWRPEQEWRVCDFSHSTRRNGIPATIVRQAKRCLIDLNACALAERRRLTGEQTPEALIAGYEVGIRAGLVVRELYPTYHGSGSWGGLGTAAIAARLLGLSHTATAHALGVAEYHWTLAPIMRCAAVPGMVKDGVAWSAFSVMCGTLHAADGFTSTPSFFGAPEAEQLTGSLVHGDVGPGQVLEGALQDEQVTSLMRIVGFRHRPDVQAEFPACRIVDLRARHPAAHPRPVPCRLTAIPIILSPIASSKASSINTHPIVWMAARQQMTSRIWKLEVYGCPS
jgi:2-methylcitrate dehydratase PrpD